MFQIAEVSVSVPWGDEIVVPCTESEIDEVRHMGPWVLIRGK